MQIIMKEHNTIAILFTSIILKRIRIIPAGTNKRKLEYTIFKAFEIFTPE